MPVFRAELSGRVKLSARGITIELSRKIQHDNFISMARQKACTFKKCRFWVLNIITSTKIGAHVKEINRKTTKNIDKISYSRVVKSASLWELRMF